MNLIDEFLTNYHSNTANGGKIAFFLFVFGHLIICILTAILCFVTKKVKIVYDVSGYFLGSSLISTFACLIILIPLALLSFNFKTTFYTGVVVTMISYVITFRFFNVFDSIGKKLN